MANPLREGLNLTVIVEARHIGYKSCYLMYKVEKL